jgi:hypothetical protein
LWRWYNLAGLVWVGGWPIQRRGREKGKALRAVVREAPQHCRTRRGGRRLRSKSVVAQAYHPCSSLLIRVHLRFHFLLPEQARNRRGATIVISGETLQNRRGGVQQNNQQPRPRIVTLSATDDRPPLWFGCGRPRCGLWVELASHPHTPVLRGYTLGAFPNLVVVRFYASPDRSAVKPVGHLPAWTGLAPRHDRAPDLLVTQLARG